MRKILVDQLEPGMVLAKPVLRGTSVLIGAGMVLADTTIARIQSLDINHVFIEGRSIQPVSREEALALLDRRFRYSEENPLMMHIKSLVREHIGALYD